MQVGTNLTINLQEGSTFLNKIKQCRLWGANVTGGGRVDGMEDVFDLDSDGYPLSLNGVGSQAGHTYDEIDCSPLFAANAPYYRSGHWVFLWDGTATTSNFSFKGPGLVDLTPISSAQGRIILNITEGTQDVFGIRITMTGIDAGHSVSNMRLVYGGVINGSDTEATSGTTGTYEQQLADGEVIDPDWFGKFGRFAAYRFMDWFLTNDSTSTGYPTYDAARVFWGILVPTEVCVYLCNKASADAWFCIPALVSDTAVVTIADRVLNGNTDNAGRVWSGLNSSLNCYVEYYNELFNSFSKDPNTTMDARGNALFPSAGNDTNADFYYYYMRTAQLTNIWKDNWGGSSRVIRVQGMQLGGDTDAYLGQSSTNGGGYTFSCNGHISGTTLTIDNSFSGTIPTNASTGVTIEGFGGQLLSGTGIANQTYILANISGTGNGSTWTVSKSQTVGSGGSPVAITGRYYNGTNGSNVDRLAVAPYVSLDSQFAGMTMDDLWTEVDGATQTFTASISGTTMTVTAVSGGLLYAGLEITSGAAAGTTIVQQLTKTSGEYCGTGTYEVSISQTVASGSLGAEWGDLISAIGRTIYPLLKAAASYSVPLICYEGGQSFINGSDSARQTLFVNAKSDARMYTMYTDMLTALDSAGVELFMNFADVSRFEASSFGCWGCIPHPLTSTSDATAQQYNALVAFLPSLSMIPFLSGSLSFRLHS